MNFNDLVFKKENPWVHHPKRARVFFPNWYGASVIIWLYSYGGKDGEYELAVLKWTEDKYQLCYDTTVTSDVIWYLTPEQVTELLNQIESLWI